MDTDERLQRMESDIHEMKADMSDIKVSLAKIEAVLPHLATKESVAKMETTLESTLPHLATKESVAKMETTLESTLPMSPPRPKWKRPNTRPPRGSTGSWSA